ncbi:MAG TPA: hypothetical protein VKD67_05525 [Acidimicrobiales bacterium]|nr:hypothetical protein [Acidimicrobiales bacterium]
MSMPNWAEQVTAIATVVLAVGAVGAIGAAVLAGQQVREARIGRQAEAASDFFKRWSDDPMVETRRLVASYGSPEALRDALLRHVAANDTEAYVLFREPDYFEQLGALEQHGGFDFEMIRALLGRRLIDRWNLWEPSITALGGPSVYPLFAHLVHKMEIATAGDPT